MLSELSEEYAAERLSGASTLDPAAPAAAGCRELDRHVVEIWRAATMQVPALALMLAANQLQVVPRAALDQSEFGAVFHFKEDDVDMRANAAVPREFGASTTLPHRATLTPKRAADHARFAANQTDRGRVPSRLIAAILPERSRAEVNTHPPESLFDELGL